MVLFDPSEYELPSLQLVNWSMTKNELAKFLMAYKISRERIGLSASPHYSHTGSLAAESMNVKLVVTPAYEKEFLRLDASFRHGFYAIMHPFQPEQTLRRRKIFYFRYLYGLAIPLVSERIHYQKNLVIDESKLAVIQFMFALDLLILK